MCFQNVLTVRSKGGGTVRVSEYPWIIGVSFPSSNKVMMKICRCQNANQVNWFSIVILNLITLLTHSLFNLTIRKFYKFIVIYNAWIKNSFWSTVVVSAGVPPFSLTGLISLVKGISSPGAFEILLLCQPLKKTLRSMSLPFSGCYFPIPFLILMSLLLLISVEIADWGYLPLSHGLSQTDLMRFSKPLVSLITQCYQKFENWKIGNFTGFGDTST